MTQKSQEYYNERMRNLANVGKKLNESSESTQRTLIDYIKSDEGFSYGIIKENHEYIIKKSTSSKDVLNESDFVYINGIQDKKKYSEKHLGEAQKSRLILVKSLNEAFSSKPIINESNEVINESVQIEVSDPLSFISGVLSKNKSKINESFDGKLKENIKKHTSGFKATDLNESLANSMRKSMQLINEGPEDVKSDIDRAITALDNLETKTDEVPQAEPTPEPASEVNTEPTQEQPIETPEQTDLSTEPVDSADAEPTDLPDATEPSQEPTPDTPIETDNEQDNAITKEIEKLVGKLTYDVRNAELTPEQTNSFLKSILTSFENELVGLDPNQKKELVKKINEPEPNAEQSTEVPTDIQQESFEDTDVAGQESEYLDGETQACDECGTFEAYSKSKGYDNLDESSPIEKGYVISGYIDGYKNGKNDGDFKQVGRHLTPEVIKELAEYGHDEYLKEAEIYSSNMDSEIEPEQPIEGEIKEDTDFDGDDFDNMSDEEKEELFQEWLRMKRGFGNKKQVDFAPNGQTLGVVSPNKSNDVNETIELDKEKKEKSDVEPKDKTLTEAKLRSFIRNVLDECISGKKSTINESAIKQSPNLQKIESYVKDQFKALIKK